MSRNPSIHLTEHQQQNIAELVNSGRYQNASEVMRAGLRLLLDQEDQRKALLTRLETAALEGLNSPIVEDFDSTNFLARKKAQWQGQD